MEDNSDSRASGLTDQTASIVAAYVSHNAVPVAEIGALIAAVHASLAGLGAASVAVEPDTKASAAEIRKSIKPDALISFVDGRPYKTLKRHLSGYGLDAAGYRAKYGLPTDYPMVAAGYAARRSELAKSLGLGQIRRTRAAAKAASTSEAVTEAAPAKKRAGRPRKAAAA